MQNKLNIYITFLLVLSFCFILLSCSSIEDDDKTISPLPESSQAEVSKRVTVGTNGTTERSKDEKTINNISASQIDNTTHKGDRQIFMRTEFSCYSPNTDAIKLFLECNDGKEFGFDTHYSIEKRIGDNWSRLPFKNNAVFQDIVQYAKPVPGSSKVSTVTTIYTRNLQENLSPGLYRVSKTVDEQTIYAEFSVE